MTAAATRGATETMSQNSALGKTPELLLDVLG
jgi:hypothetical protein